MYLLIPIFNVHSIQKVPSSQNLDDKPKNDVDENLLGDSSKKTDRYVGLLNLNARDIRKTHKRDIDHKTKTDEVVATVLEITDVDIDETSTIASTSQPVVDSTTQPSEAEVATANETNEKEMETTTALAPSSTMQTTTTTTSDIDPGFQPILGYYYGGTPNQNANNIYFTTTSPLEELASPKDDAITVLDRNDYGDFKPSIQYEYHNYRFNSDSHFVPIIGTKQIF